MAVEWKSLSLAQRVFWHLSLLVAFLTAFGGAALAQSTAALNGTVTDATGALVPNAQVSEKTKPPESNRRPKRTLPALIFSRRCRSEFIASKSKLLVFRLR